VPVFDALVWQNIKELLLNPQLVVTQAQRRQAASPLQNQLDALHKSLKKLDDEQYRYDKAYGQNVMSVRRYKDVMNELNDKREAMVSEINALEDEMANRKPITVEQYFDGTIKRVENLNFTEKKAIIKKVITKIVATKQDISIWGRIPLLATPNGETINNNESSIYANHLENEREVGLNVEHWDCWPAKCR
jgi:chaperonin cofactor prefoldin